MDQEHIFVLHEFIDGEVWNWFCHHVLHTNRDKQDWTFKEVLIGLYNRFVNVATMQEAREAFRTAVYDAQMGIQTFYKELIGHAQNIAVYPDEFTIRETFLDGISAEMCCALIHDDNLSPEVNTVTKFLTYAIRYEQSACTATHYDQHSLRCTQGHCQPVKPVQGPTGDTPVTKENWYAPRAGQPVQKRWDGPPQDCKVPKVQVQAAHTAAADSDAESNAEEDQEELINDKEVPSEVEEPGDEDDTESVHINGDEYVMVDVYDNEYYMCEDDEEHTQGHRQPAKVGTFLAKCSKMERNHNPWFVVQSPKAQVQAAHTAAANSDAESNAEEEQEELVNDKEVSPEVEEPEAEDDAESVHINGDEYVTVDIYDN
ncbi:hypothetical protein C0995_009023, partial [Termitomyces sp. Mi166